MQITARCLVAMQLRFSTVYGHHGDNNIIGNVDSRHIHSPVERRFQQHLDSAATDSAISINLAIGAASPLIKKLIGSPRRPHPLPRQRPSRASC